MNCTQYLEERVLEAHGEPGPAPEFRAHLAACPDCRVAIEDMREISAEYRKASSAVRLPHQIPLPRRRILHPAIPALAAALFIALLVGPWFSPSKPEPRREAIYPESFLSIDDQIEMTRVEVLTWDDREARIDLELGRLRRDVEAYEWITNDM